MKKAMKCIAVIFFVITATSLLWAGNREMVEKRVDELDKLNKEAVTRIAGEPESGKINFKVRVIPGKDGYRFESVEKETISSMPENLLPLHDENKFFTFREGIARLAHKKPSITPYKNYSNDGEYISFKDAIIRRNGSNK
ncbi:MAG: hypothetical protein QG578_641 [Thermodesulfobacteriota bacterium]|nr:hypothetical protein [Thermodesulfobacteriota bacterium]